MRSREATLYAFKVKLEFNDHINSPLARPNLFNRKHTANTMLTPFVRFSTILLAACIVASSLISGTDAYYSSLKCYNDKTEYYCDLDQHEDKIVYLCAYMTTVNANGTTTGNERFGKGCVLKDAARGREAVRIDLGSND